MFQHPSLHQCSFPVIPNFPHSLPSPTLRQAYPNGLSSFYLSVSISLSVSLLLSHPLLFCTLVCRFARLLWKGYIEYHFTFIQYPVSKVSLVHSPILILFGMTGVSEVVFRKHEGPCTGMLSQRSQSFNERVQDCYVCMDSAMSGISRAI